MQAGVDEVKKFGLCLKREENEAENNLGKN